MGALQVFALCAIILLSQRVDCEISAGELKQLLALEMHMVKNFETYSEEILKIHDNVEKFLQKVDQKHEKIKDNPDYYHNPLNAYNVIKDMVEMKIMEPYAQLNETYEKFKAFESSNNLYVQSQELSYPDQSVMIDAAKRVKLEEDKQSLDAKAVPKDSSAATSTLSANDCYWLGRSFFDHYNYREALKWLTKSRITLEQELMRDNNELFFPFITEEHIFGLMASTYYALGKSNMAAHLNDLILILNPNNTYAKEIAPIFERTAIQQRRSRTRLELELE